MTVRVGVCVRREKMTSQSPKPQYQQQQPASGQQQYEDAQLVNVDHLSDAERQLIIAVLDRDSAIRQKEQSRIKLVFFFTADGVVNFATTRPKWRKITCDMI